MPTPEQRRAPDSRSQHEPARPRDCAGNAQVSARQREAVRQIVVAVAKDALAVDDEKSFKRLLDSLDERAIEILRVLGRA